jgi:arylsulfatase A-like enzyme
MVVRWPGHVKESSRCEVPVIGTDFYPTFLDLAGAEPPTGWRLDGESLMPLLLGGGSLERDAIFWHFPAYLNKWPEDVEVEGPFRETPAGAMRMGDWKIIEHFEDGRIELYNLREDVGETRNLAEAMPGRARELHRRMALWREEVGAPVPKEPNPAYVPPR